MQVKIEKEVLGKYPGLNIGFVIAKNLDNKGKDKKLNILLKEVEKLIRLDFIPENIARHPLISPWKTVYEEFGKKPEKNHTIVEQLMRRIFAKKTIKSVSKLVDLKNYITLKYLVPVGVFDIDKIEGDLALGFSKSRRRFKPESSSKKEMTDYNEVVYKDDNDVLCRKWNWKESEKTKITKGTKNAVFCIDGINPVKQEKISQIAKDLAELLAVFCSAKTEIYILNKSNTWFKHV